MKTDSMTLLIDGYNLLHVTGITGVASGRRSAVSPKGHVRRQGPTQLQRSREALLRFLAASIDATDLPRTTVVFDAHDAPPGLPRKVDCQGMTILYAAEYADADTLIEELIQREAAPRSLLVVSSDHRIQRAARRRRATPIDSDRWYRDLCRQRVARLQNRPPQVDKPTGPLSDAEIDYWLRQFMPDTEFLTDANLAEDDSASVTSSTTEDNDGTNPFPPGYGEDLLEE